MTQTNMFKPYYDMKNITGKVAKLLGSEPETRNCDLLLIERYMLIHHDVVTLADWRYNKDEIRCTPESIRRCSAKIQSAGYYLPTNSNIKIKRKLVETEMRAWVTGGGM